MRRRLTGLVLVGALMLPTTTFAQSPGPTDDVLRFLDLAADQRIPDLLSQGLDAVDDVRAVVADQRAQLLTIDPDACWNEAYVGYIEALALLDASMALMTEQPEAAATLLGMSVERRSFDATQLASCFGT